MSSLNSLSPLISFKSKTWFWLKAICNAYNIEKLLTVNPIEFVNYFESDNPLTCPITQENETHEKVLKEFKKTVIMRVNMVFGSNSYLVRYLQQNWLCNHSPFDGDQYKHFRFNPMYLIKLIIIYIYYL